MNLAQYKASVEWCKHPSSDGFQERQKKKPEEERFILWGIKYTRMSIAWTDSCPYNFTREQSVLETLKGEDHRVSHRASRSSQPMKGLAHNSPRSRNWTGRRWRGDLHTKGNHHPASAEVTAAVTQSTHFRGLNSPKSGTRSIKATFLKQQTDTSATVTWISFMIKANSDFFPNNLLPCIFGIWKGFVDPGRNVPYVESNSSAQYFKPHTS